MSGNSAKWHGNTEWSSILNRVSREDDPIATIHASAFVNGINILLVDDSVSYIFIDDFPVCQQLCNQCGVWTVQMVDQDGVGCRRGIFLLLFWQVPSRQSILCVCVHTHISLRAVARVKRCRSDKTCSWARASGVRTSEIKKKLGTATFYHWQSIPSPARGSTHWWTCLPLHGKKWRLVCFCFTFTSHGLLSFSLQVT